MKGSRVRRSKFTTTVLGTDVARRKALIASLRGSESKIDCTYTTVRYGTVPNYHGSVVVGDTLLVGVPAAGSAEILTRAGYVVRYSLALVPTDRLQRLVEYNRRLRRFA